ncbi:MAG: GGDEF domain-containing protein [Burkholderiales bacterium]|nr:GGDEF domain-containing protein [Burkholderiales bacterium]
MPHYRSLSPLNLWRLGSPTERFVVFGLWGLMLLASVGLGLASVIWHWSGLPLEFGGVVVYITVYPPLPICLFLTLSCGWRWGAPPAYLATLTLALYAGMPLPWALLFACANPLGLAVMAIGYQAIAVRRDLRDSTSLLFFVQLSFVASIFSSSGALIWCYTNGIDRTEVLPIWQGWWLGGFLQSVLMVGPVMALLWPRIARWQARRPGLLRTPRGDARHSVLRLLGVASTGVLVYGFLTIQLAGSQLERAVIDGVPAIGHAAGVMQQTTWAFYWVFALIVLFIAFFGYQLFTHWQRATDALLDELHRANQGLEALAHTDALTGLLNRRGADARLHDEWHRAARLGSGAALVLLDIDHFKHINDRHGHAAGDVVLRSLALAIQAQTRAVDIAGRYGGEEFLIILPQADAPGAQLFAERLRHCVAAQAAAHGGRELRFTISLGVAALDAADASHAAWLQRADLALYRAKAAGRNRTEVAAPPGEGRPDLPTTSGTFTG